MSKTKPSPAQINSGPRAGHADYTRLPWGCHWFRDRISHQRCPAILSCSLFEVQRTASYHNSKPYKNLKVDHANGNRRAAIEALHVPRFRSSPRWKFLLFFSIVFLLSSGGQVLNATAVCERCLVLDGIVEHVFDAAKALAEKRCELNVTTAAKIRVSCNILNGSGFTYSPGCDKQLLILMRKLPTAVIRSFSSCLKIESRSDGIL